MIVRSDREPWFPALENVSGKWVPALRFALFSGGHDSLTSTHYAMTHGLATEVVHVNTGIGIEETREFVRATCAEHGWPLNEIHPPIGYEECCFSRGWTRASDGSNDRLYGLPGPGMHPVVYRMLKERSLAAFARSRKPKRGHPLIYVTGARQQESERRMANVSGEWQPAPKRGWTWHSPLYNYTALDVARYIGYHDLKRNPVVDVLHMSGECLCGSFARPGERREIATWYPKADAQIRDLETRAKDQGHLARVWGKRPPDVHRFQLDFDLDDEMMMCRSCGVAA